VNDNPGVTRTIIISLCEVAFVSLSGWQAVGAPQPAAGIATGVVLAVRKAASIRWTRGDG
jgi:hypothetical protein